MMRLTSMRNLALAALIVLAALASLAVLPASAQDAVSPLSGTWTYTAYTSAYECGSFSGSTGLDDLLDDADFNPEFPIYVSEDGEQLLIAFAGDDMLYTRTGPDSYTGTMVDPLEDYAYAGALTVLDAETVQIMASLDVGEDCHYDYDLQYSFVDEALPELWRESERDLYNISMTECLSQTSLAEVWPHNDLYVPILRSDEDGDDALRIGDRLLESDEGGYLYTMNDARAYSEMLVTPVDEDTMSIAYSFQIEYREDCAVEYTSTLTRVEPFSALPE